MNLDPGIILAGLSVAANIASVAGVLSQWLSRDRSGRSIMISLDGKSIKIDGVDEKSHEDLIAWYKAEIQTKFPKD